MELAKIHTVRNRLQAVMMGASVLKEQLAKLEVAPERVRGDVLPAKDLATIDAAAERMGRELASWYKAIGASMAARGLDGKQSNV
jgi:hypothetical protein